MKRLFLTSSVHAVAHDIAKKLDLSTHNRLVFITTPVEPEKGEKNWLNNDRQALVDVGFTVTDYTITDKTYEQLRNDLSSYDYIYMSGGNTAYLLDQSQKTGFLKLIKELVETEGKTYISTSAGSIITGPRIPTYYLAENPNIKLSDLTGYGFVNFTILPHWGSEHFRPKYFGGRLEIAYKTDQVPLLVLTDTQYIYVENNQFEIIDTTPTSS